MLLRCKVAVSVRLNHESRIKPVLGSSLMLRKEIVYVCKGLDSYVAPGKYGRVRCARGNHVEEGNQFRHDTFLVVAKLLGVRPPKIQNASGSKVAILHDGVCLNRIGVGRVGW